MLGLALLPQPQAKGGPALTPIVEKSPLALTKTRDLPRKKQ